MEAGYTNNSHSDQYYQSYTTCCDVKLLHTRTPMDVPVSAIYRSYAASYSSCGEGKLVSFSIDRKSWWTQHMATNNNTHAQYTTGNNAAGECSLEVCSLAHT